MRLWTLHPKYLDAKGLVALWREALLAQKVLRGGTRGYQHHPQLLRFRKSQNPQAAIASYLAGVLEEAKRRGYSFDSTKIPSQRLWKPLNETKGQLRYEWRHLQKKLKRRSPALYNENRLSKTLSPHPLFRIVSGKVRSWERLR
jgi:hypothetical protein